MMKCHECEREAEWLVIDQVPYEDLFLPLCEEHFQELRVLEGEINLDFDLIENLTIEDIIVKTNEKWKWATKRYTALLKLYSDLQKKEREGDNIK